MERRYHAKNGKIYLINERFDYKIGPNGEPALNCSLSANEEGKRGSPIVIDVSENQVRERIHDQPEMTEEKKKSILLAVALDRLEERLTQSQ